MLASESNINVTVIMPLDTAICHHTVAHMCWVGEMLPGWAIAWYLLASHAVWQVLFKEPMWQGLSAEDRLQFLQHGVCPGGPNTPLNLVCRNEWMHYLVSYVQPWEPVDILLDTVYTFVQSEGHALSQQG